MYSRPALVYGKEVKGNLFLIKRAVEGGWCPPLPKIYNQRSMIHVDDLAKAIMLIKKKGENRIKIIKEKKISKKLFIVM